MPFIEVNYPHEVLVVLFNEFNTGVIRLYGLPICHVFLTDVYKATFCASSPPPPSRFTENTDPWPHDFVTHLTSAQGRWTNSRGFMKIILLYRIILTGCFLYAYRSYCAFSDFVEVLRYIRSSLLYITIYCLWIGIENWTLYQKL